MRRSLALLPLLLIACAPVAASEDSASDEANATEATNASWAPYANDIRPDLHRLEPLTPSGVVVGDFGSSVRDQGHIASCASFSFLGMIENQMFNERGVSPDLSERYMLYSNFLQTGTMGGRMDIIGRFAELTSNVGVMNEELYPYSEVEKNSIRFEADAAQGLDTDKTQVLLTDAVKDTEAMSKARSSVIEKAEYVGALPKGPYPVRLPMKATLQPNAKLTQIEYQGKFYDCFATDPSAKPRLAVTPKEAMKMCFDVDPSQYFSCDFDADAEMNRIGSDPTLESSGDRCTDLKTFSDLVAKAQYAKFRHSLQLALGLLEAGDAVMLALQAGGVSPIWTTKMEPGGGHAVLAVGYLSYEDLGKVSEQSRGMLGNGMFDKLLAIVDATHMAKIDAATTDEEKMNVRLNSPLGLRLKDEGGLILFRNSWGTKAPGGDLPIGVDGHQAMTFEYYVRAGMGILGRKQKRLDGFVSWAPGNACPTTNTIGLAGAWAERTSSPVVDKQWRDQLVPADCQ